MGKHAELAEPFETIVENLRKGIKTEMKKPEKLKTWFGCRGYWSDVKVGVANEMWDKMEAYYKQEIKENYIRKDSLPSEDEIEKVIYTTEGIYTISQRPASGGAWARKVNRIAKAIIKSIKGK